MKFEHFNSTGSLKSTHAAANVGADESLMDDLVASALEAERFEAMALGQDATYKFPSGASRAGAVVAASGSSAGLRPWVRFGSLAAAAAIAVTTFVVLRAPVKPVNNEVAKVPEHVRPSGSDVLVHNPDEHRETPTDVTPRIELAKLPSDAESMPSLESYAHLDPAILNGGVPTLTGNRSLVMAVFRGDESDCDCFKWAVKEVGDSLAAPEEMAKALNTPCAAASRAVTVVSITGPRDLLPFHDADAHELVQCIADVAAETDIDADDLREATMAALCLPDELSIEAKSVTLASR